MQKEVNMTKVSVIIPTFKRSELLANAIDSVINQSEKDIEIIIVSDGIDKKTQEVVNQLKKKDVRIKFYEYEISKGGNFARNFGAKNSSSEILAFLDDDDTWNKDKLKKQLAMLNSNEKIGLVYTGINQIYPEKNIEFSSKPSLKGDLSKKILFKNYIGTTSTVMLRKSLFDKVEGFDENLSAKQDYDLWIRICQICEVSYIKSNEVNYYNRTTSNQISVNVDKYEKAHKYIMNKYKELFIVLSKKEKNSIFTNNKKLLANKFNKNKELKKSLKYSIEGFLIEKTMKNALYIAIMLVPFEIQLSIRSFIRK